MRRVTDFDPPCRHRPNKAETLANRAAKAIRKDPDSAIQIVEKLILSRRHLRHKVTSE